MLPELSEIKFKRRQNDLTQLELARISGASQSMIAKLESGKIVPSYESAKKLFDVLEKVHEKTQMVAKDAMTAKMLFTSPKERLKKAVRVLEKNGLSQLPVLAKGQSVGLVTEKGILASIGKGTSIETAKVAEVMEEACPTIQENTPLNIVSSLLDYNNSVLVKKKGKIMGIITKSNLLETMLKAK